MMLLMRKGWPVVDGLYKRSTDQPGALSALEKGSEGIGLCQTITADNGPEFAGIVIDGVLIAMALS